MLPVQRTHSTKPAEVTRKWYVVDAKDQVLGRISTRIATVLRGKHKPVYTPSVDCGDFVIVLNSDKVKLTGSKWDDKKYYRHSGHVGGLKTATAKEIHQKDSTQLITLAVKGMLPKNILGRHMIKKLKVYKDEKHPHESQKPEVLRTK